MNSWIFAAAVAAALAAPAAPAQTVQETVVVKRPDGSVVYGPAAAPASGGTSWWLRESATRADERERARLESQAVTGARIEQSKRQREAADTNPASQIPPATGR